MLDIRDKCLEMSKNQDTTHYHIQGKVFHVQEEFLCRQCSIFRALHQRKNDVDCSFEKEHNQNRVVSIEHKNMVSSKFLIMSAQHNN